MTRIERSCQEVAVAYRSLLRCSFILLAAGRDPSILLVHVPCCITSRTYISVQTIMAGSASICPQFATEPGSLADFGAHMQFLGASSHLQQPGDYLSSLVTDSPYVACVDQAGGLQAYHNVSQPYKSHGTTLYSVYKTATIVTMLQVCRHHAASVCEEGHGKTDHFKCPYHGWEYGRANVSGCQST